MSALKILEKLADNIEDMKCECDYEVYEGILKAIEELKKA